MNEEKGLKSLKKIWLRLFVALSLCLVWVFLAPCLAENLIVEKPLEKADAILILGGSSTFVERTQKAAELYKKGVAPQIFLTNDGQQGGWNVEEQRNPFFYERAKWELVANGVPENVIEILPEVVEGTNDEAVLFEKTAREKGVKKVLIVTSAYHTRRALSVFELVFRNNSAEIEIGITSPPTGEQTPKPFNWWFSPNGWKFVAGEYVKIVGYWLFY